MNGYKNKVLLADDHTIVREGLKALLKTQKDIEVVGEAQTGTQAVQLTKVLAPHVVIMDLAMPELSGIEATRLIRKEVPSTQVLILSTYGNEQYVQELISLGVGGYLLKQNAANELIKALREILKGNAYFSPSISRRLLEQTREAFENGDRRRPPRRLTAREREVLALIAQGNANKMVADRLGISIKTVEKHRQSLMAKLRIRETAGLTRYALESGII